ncbi:hypothetical protein JCM33374_g1671 [Metschnikowia sp. JCM 33374]|nr:hypothetical protein JCM33374_g1671 [Metschnikowia sp. JCM 33374]
MISLPMTIFRPIHSVESAESLSRSGSYIPVPAPMRGSSVLTRFRRLVEDLEVSQGIRLARVVGISSDSQKPREEEYAGDSDDYDTNESSFTESMLAVDECITTGGPPDLVKWLAGQFKKSKKSRHVSIDGLIMSYGVSESFQNVGVAHGLSRWKPFKLQDMRRQSTQTNVITRVFNHWRISRSADPVVVSTFIINRSPGDRLSGIF